MLYVAMVLFFAASDPGLVTATIGLAAATILVAVPAAWSALISARQMRRNLLPIIVPAKPDGMKRVARFTPAKHVWLENADSFAQEDAGTVYLAICLRNIGSGVAVVRGTDATSAEDAGEFAPVDIPALTGLMVTRRALYLGQGEAAYLTFVASPASTGAFGVIHRGVSSRSGLLIDLVYCDHAGGQLTISRLELSWSIDVNRYVARIVNDWRPGRFKRRKIASRIKNAPQLCGPNWQAPLPPHSSGFAADPF